MMMTKSNNDSKSKSIRQTSTRSSARHTTSSGRRGDSSGGDIGPASATSTIGTLYDDNDDTIVTTTNKDGHEHDRYASSTAGSVLGRDGYNNNNKQNSSNDKDDVGNDNDDDEAVGRRKKEDETQPLLLDLSHDDVVGMLRELELRMETKIATAVRKKNKNKGRRPFITDNPSPLTEDEDEDEDDDDSSDDDDSNSGRRRSNDGGGGGTNAVELVEERKHPEDTYSFLITARGNCCFGCCCCCCCCGQNGCCIRCGLTRCGGGCCSFGMSAPYMMGWFVWFIQAVLFALVLHNRLSWQTYLESTIVDSLGNGQSEEYSDESILLNTNRFRLPLNVPLPVRCAQVIALLIALFVEDDIRVAVERNQVGYTDLQNNGNFIYSTKFKWWLSYSLRGLNSLLGLVSIFVLIVQEDDVFELLLNFTGLSFVSTLDDIAFVLGKTGFFGEAIREETILITNLTYKIPPSPPLHLGETTRQQSLQSKRTSTNGESHGECSWLSCCFCTSESAARAFLLGFLTIIMYAGFGYTIYLQYSGQLLCPAVEVTFGSNVESMGTFTGTYELAPRLYFGRSVYYKRIPTGSGDNQTTSTSNRYAMFSYDGGWEFSICDVDGGLKSINSDCLFNDVNRHLIAYAAYTESHDIRDNNDIPWYIFDVSSRKIEDLLQETIEFQCSWYGPTASMSYSKCRDDASYVVSTSGGCNNACPEIRLDPSSKFPRTTTTTPIASRDGDELGDAWITHPREFSLLTTTNGQERESGNVTAVVAYDHPIYWALASLHFGRQEASIAVLDLIVFTGKRWVILDTTKLFPGATFSFNELYEAVVEYFSHGFHALQLSSNTGHAITFLSDEVDKSWGSSLSPIGIGWHKVIYPEDDDNAIVDDDFYINYYSHDWFPQVGSKIEAASFSCIFCDTATNPCEYDGTCNTNGKCDCLYGTTGPLCDIIPLGNGQCNDYFNTDEFGYDGGDCCGATCDGPGCLVPLPTYFGKSMQVDTLTSIGRGFPDCADPFQVPISIIIIGDLFAKLELICDGETRYLSSNDRIVASSDNEEVVFVKDGTDCQLKFTEIFYFEIDSIVVRYMLSNSNEVGVASASNSFPLAEYHADPNVEFTETTATLDFSVISKCLLGDLSQFVVFDESFFLNQDSPQLQGMTWLNSFVSDGSVCSNDILNGDNNKTIVAQQYAMAVLSSAGWFEQARHCEWPIVQCLPDGRVTEIYSYQGYLEDFYGGNTTTTQPNATEGDAATFMTEIGLLYDLEKLVLPGFNFMESALPTWIGRLTKLDDLELDKTGLTGTLPSELGSLSKLVLLYLFENELTGIIPSELGRLVDVVDLQIDNNQLTGPIPTEITKIESLEILYLSENLLSGTIPFKELSTMSSLNFLFLQNNLFTGNLSTEIGNFYNLTILWLENNDNLEGSIPSEIGLLSTSIQSLDFSNNKFNNQLPTEFGILTNLVELGLHNNTFTGTIPTEFGLLTSLEALDLSSNLFTGSIPSELGLLSNLLFLDLSGNTQLGTTSSGGTNTQNNEIPIELKVLCQNNVTTCFL